MNMKSILCLSVIFILTGCPLSQKVNLLNNSAVDETLILVGDKQKHWAHAEVISIADKGGNDFSWKELVWEGDPKSNYFLVLMIECNQQIREYELSLLYGYDEIKDSNGRVIKYQLQLEGDCNLYMVPAGHKMPLEDISKKYLFSPICTKGAKVLGTNVQKCSIEKS